MMPCRPMDWKGEEAHSPDLAKKAKVWQHRFMDLLRVAGATLNQTPLDFSGNRDRILAMLAQARTLGVELLLLPELCITGYGCEDAFFSLSTAKTAEATLLEVLPATAGMTVVLGLPHFYYGAMFNCVVLVQDRKVLGVNAKRVLPREGVHYEPRWFRPWPFGKVAQTTIGGVPVPLGDLRYRLGTLGIAIEICEEAWDSVPASAAHSDAVDLILNPSASHFALGKYAKREHLVANSSRSMQVIYVYTNLLGLEAGRMIYDGGVLFAEGGEIVARGRRFGFGDGELLYRDVNPDLASLAKLKVRPIRENNADLTPLGDELRQVEVQGVDPRLLLAKDPTPRSAKGVATVPRKSTAAAATSHEYAALSRHEEFLQAQMLGLFDYLRKAGATGYVVSLSGGVDSASCAVLVAQMLATAAQELGLLALTTKLNLPLIGHETVKQLISRVLTCVYLNTRNSGEVTRHAAESLASELGATFHLGDVQPAVDIYTQTASSMLKRPLTWERDDVTLQNIQARARAPMVWMMANALGAILLTTSNRSEAAVGYATMDGDTAGGLAPLAGIDKHFLRQWLVWAEQTCPIGLGPLASLREVNAQAPTAELRPPSSGQHDEADLMPYAVLERIERYLVRDRLGPGDILQSLTYDFPATDAHQLKGYLNKFFRLWSQNQWKRERYAPAFHLDDESLDPKTWCRFPILSRAYRVE